jgi:hypothetical protein
MRFDEHIALTDQPQPPPLGNRRQPGRRDQQAHPRLRRRDRPGQHHEVLVAGRKLADVLPCRHADLHGQLVGCRPITELAIIIQAPGPKGAVGFQRIAGVPVIIRRDLDDVGKPHHQHRREAETGRVVADLIVVVLAPGVDRAGRSKGQAVVLTAGDCGDVG